MTRNYFGTDGVRGTVGEAPITPEFVLKLGQAAGRVLVRHAAGQSGRPAVLIGKDTRISGYMLEAALEAGFSSAGVDVVLSGPLPTPAVAYLTRALRLTAGIVISASHNPYPDNGIKFFSARGTKLPDAVEEEIERELDQPWHCVEAKFLGKVRRLEDAAGRYIEFCKRTFPTELDLKGLKIVVDSAHGAAYHVAPHVFHELGAEVVWHGASPNGMNINDGVGALHGEQLAHAVEAAEADFGIALDGDADRLTVCDADGRLYNGDELLYVIVRDRMRHARVDGVVGTLMTNYALERRLAELGVAFARAKVGDRYVLEVLEEKGWLYGGEGSGHLLCLDCHTTGDGTVSALQVLAAMRRSGKSLAQLTSDLVLLPQALVNARIERGFDWKSYAPLVDEMSVVEQELKGAGRVLIRPSGTEPVLRVMVEASEPEIAEAMAQRLAGRLAAPVHR
ncbi:MAG TPA: phosphoglucosamine mutase [Burkholderiaceae bacterium]|nr:phosphoglucosamine mutase [Burkholderiaceae bacterium]HQR72141.1 phosphoglucosamine mutase [Burkholderiaceae bacterium]